MIERCRKCRMCMKFSDGELRCYWMNCAVVKPKKGGWSPDHCPKRHGRELKSADQDTAQNVLMPAT